VALSEYEYVTESLVFIGGILQHGECRVEDPNPTVSTVSI